MLDIAVAHNKFGFLGNEFLTWLWSVIDNGNNINELTGLKNENLKFWIGNNIVLENGLCNGAPEKVSVKGNDAGLEEAVVAMKKGAVVTNLNLVLDTDQGRFTFSIKGEDMQITGFKPPPVVGGAGEDEMEGAVLEKAYLCTKVFKVIDSLFETFIRQRISEVPKKGGGK